MDTDDGDATAGSSLRRYRFRAGLTQDELAERAGLSVRAVRYIEQGRVARPQASSMRRLADALGLTGPDRDALLAGPAPAEPPRADALRIEVLGPLVVRRAALPVEIESSMLGDLLGLLAIQPRQLISVEEIVDTLWGEQPPRTCVSLVHTYVSQLRRLLEPDRPHRAPAVVLPRVRGGYRLELDAVALDLAEFDASVARGRAASAEDAIDTAWTWYTRASTLWRGPLLADGAGRLRQHAAAVAIGQRRVAAALEHADLALILGQGEQVLDGLRALAEQEPLDERVTARLMLVLASCGQQAAALDLFASIRERLDLDLGVEPGRELRAAHLRVLRDEELGPVPAVPPVLPLAGPVPAQLPADVAPFTGRAGYLRQLDDLLPPLDDGARRSRGDAAPAPTVIVAVVGMGGVGKTALVVHWAHQVRDRFPDGQLYVNLRGHAGGRPLRPIEALAGFLRAFGLPPDHVPDDLEQAAALYRSRLADLRVLVVLDDAVGVEQVRPLLPGGSGSLALVTGRGPIGGLVAREGARRVALNGMTPGESVTLIGQMLGSRRVRAEPAAAAELAALCAHLPLALRIAGANLGSRPHQSVRDYVERLRAGNRLAALSVDGDPDTAVKAAFDLSYAALPDREQRVFRRLGLLPGPDLDAEAAAHLAGSGLAEAAAALGFLATRHLVEDRADGRYAVHDLLRLHAAELAEAHDPEPDRRQARGRLTDHYLRTVRAAADTVYPHLLHLPRPPAQPDPGPARAPVGFPDSAAALAWLDAERPNLVAAIVALAAEGDARAWLLADVLQGYFRLRANPLDWTTVSTAARDAAIAAGDLRAQSAAELSIGSVHYLQSRYSQATEHYGIALELAQRAGWTDGQAVTLNNLALLRTLAGRPEESIGFFLRALALHRQTGRVAGQAVSLANLGVAHLECDLATREPRRPGEEAAADGSAHLDKAMRYLNQALLLHRQIGDRRNEADTLRVLAGAYRDAGRLTEALELADEALALARASADRRFETVALNALGTVHIGLGRGPSALDYHRQALTYAAEVGDQGLHAQVLTDLAQTCIQLGEYQRAQEYAEEALTFSRNVGSRLIEQKVLRVLTAARSQPVAAPRDASDSDRAMWRKHPS